MMRFYGAGLGLSSTASPRFVAGSRHGNLAVAKEGLGMAMKRFLLALSLLLAPAAAQQAKIQTTMGDIVLQLETEKAPKTVANFIAYAKSGHFNGTVIYRVEPRFVIQMGSMDAKGQGRPLRKPIPLETASGLKNLRGTLAMARDDVPATAQAEFFINLNDNAFLDAKPDAAPNTTGYAVFARVVAGMDVVDAIAQVPVGGGVGPFADRMPKKPITLRKVVIGQFVEVPPCVADVAPQTIAIIAARLRLVAEATTADTAFIADESVRHEIAQRLEQAFAITIANEAMAGAQSVGEVIALVEHALRDSGRQACARE